MELKRRRRLVGLVGGLTVAMLGGFGASCSAWSPRTCAPDDARGFISPACESGSNRPTRVTGTPSAAMCKALVSDRTFQQRRSAPTQASLGGTDTTPVNAAKLALQNQLDACDLETARNVVEVPCDVRFSRETMCFACMGRTTRAVAASGVHDLQHGGDARYVVVQRSCGAAAMVLDHGGLFTEPLSWDWLSELPAFRR